MTGIDRVEGGGFVVHTRVAAGPYAAHAPASQRGGELSGAGVCSVILVILLGFAAAVAAVAHPPTSRMLHDIANPGGLFLGLLPGRPHVESALTLIGGSVVCLAVLLLVACSKTSLLGPYEAPRRRRHRHRHHGAAATRAESLRARFVVNAAGCGSGDIARLLGDASFVIKPRLGEYLLLRKEEGRDKVRPLG